LDIDEMELRDDIATRGTEVRKAFYGGYAKTALKVRERNLELAEAGSPAADDAIRIYLREMLNDL